MEIPDQTEQADQDLARRAIHGTWAFPLLVVALYLATSLPKDHPCTKSIGRDHNPYGFTMWMAGGVKGGTVYGSTDEFGYFAVENKVHVHDLHATILHLLGLDHKRLTYPFSGRDMRLTDVAGEVVRGVLA